MLTFNYNKFQKIRCSYGKTWKNAVFSKKTKDRYFQIAFSHTGWYEQICGINYVFNFYFLPLNLLINFPKCQQNYNNFSTSKKDYNKPSEPDTGSILVWYRYVEYDVPVSYQSSTYAKYQYSTGTIYRYVVPQLYSSCTAIFSAKNQYSIPVSCCYNTDLPT